MKSMSLAVIRECDCDFFLVLFEFGSEDETVAFGLKVVKSRSGKVDQRDFHRLDKTLV